MPFKQILDKDPGLKAPFIARISFSGLEATAPSGKTKPEIFSSL